MNKILDSLDEFFETQKETEQKIILLLPFLLSGFIIYYFIYPMVYENYTRVVKYNKKENSKILKLERKNRKLGNENFRLTKSIQSKHKELVKLHQNKITVDNLLKQLYFLKFDLGKWANFYNKIQVVAQKYNLDIISLQNSTFVDNGSDLVQKKIEIRIKVMGKFVDLIKFVNFFETQKELIKVNFLLITKEKMLLAIDIYGAKL